MTVMDVIVNPALFVIDGDPAQASKAERVRVAGQALDHLRVTPADLTEED